MSDKREGDLDLVPDKDKKDEKAIENKPVEEIVETVAEKVDDKKEEVLGEGDEIDFDEELLGKGDQAIKPGDKTDKPRPSSPGKTTKRDEDDYSRAEEPREDRKDLESDGLDFSEDDNRSYDSRDDENKRTKREDRKKREEQTNLGRTMEETKQNAGNQNPTINAQADEIIQKHKEEEKQIDIKGLNCIRSTIFIIIGLICFLTVIFIEVI